MTIRSLLLTRLQEHQSVFQAMVKDEAFLKSIDSVGEMLVQTFKSGGKLLICGNGGSASDAQHTAAELVGRFLKNRKPLDAEALTVNTSSLTAIGNDFGYDDIFARQVLAKGKPGDVLLGISTSGNSPNILNSITAAHELKMTTVGLTGNKPNSKLNAMANFTIGVPSSDTPRIQEGHIFVLHTLCEYIENNFLD